MENSNNSAERELLKTIEQGDISNLSTLRVKKIGPAFPSLTVFFSNLSFKKIISPQSLGVLKNNTHLLLLGLVFLTGLGYILLFSSGMRRLNHIPTFKVDLTHKTDIAKKPIVSLEKDFEWYKEQLLKRNIFIPYEEKKVEEVKPEPVEIKPSINKMVEGLKVVGISWSEVNQERYVMIENLKTQTTYYLKEGDNLLNLKIEQIFSDHIVVSYEDQTIDLR